MATYQDLEMEWSMLCQSCTECWTRDDLQLAAELGKTLLERNKELEAALVDKQTLIEDKDQEIEHLTKQSAALREVSDSRLRIYEQLEISIQDLERANHRLVLDNSAGKKHIKSLTATIEGLETKCANLQTTIDDLRVQTDVLKRKAQRPIESPTVRGSGPTVVLRHVEGSPADTDGLDSPEPKVKHKDYDQCKTSTPYKTERGPPTEDGTNEINIDANMEQMSQLLAQLRESKSQTSRDQRKIAELEDQLSTMIQQNQALENQVIKLTYKDEDMKSMYDELSTLEEVRNGQMCSRCLRSVAREEDDIPEDDDCSMLDALSATSQHRSSFSMEVQDHHTAQSSSLTPSSKEPTTNLYKELVEKYEALLEIHRQPSRNQKSNCISLQEELQMSGDFNTRVSTKDTDDESGHGDSLKPEMHHLNNNKTLRCTTNSHTPTDFSEAETSSSGFSDETSNKYTQTEDRPGSFLCTIAAGEDCKVSIYDDMSPISSRFRNQPEYQELFKEIFTVLKNTAEPSKTVSSESADETLQSQSAACQKPQPLELGTSSKNNNNNEAFPEILDDDSQSVVSSTMSELSVSQNEPTTIIENIIQAQNEPIPESDEPNNPKSQECVLKPLVRQPLEYLSVEIRKRSSSKRKNKHHDRSDSPVTHIIGSPKINYTNRPSSGRRKRGDLKSHPTENEGVNPTPNVWNGSTLQFYSSNRQLASPTPSQGSGKGYFEFKPSSASHDLHKLKRLDLSYAEVLRNADNNKNKSGRQRRK